MNKPHKHSVQIKAWADGARIQHRNPRVSQEWKNFVAGVEPSWHEDIEYRVVLPFQKEIDAQKAGKMVQMRTKFSEPWQDGKWLFDKASAEWGTEYRIKPEVAKYRLFLARFGESADPVVVSVSLAENLKEERENWLSFIRWLGDWQEVEL